MSIAAAPTEAAVVEALRTVLDPELGLSIVDLGLVYAIRVEDAVVRVTMTLTARGCPLHEVMTEWVRAAVSRLPSVERVDVALTFDPPWTPDPHDDGALAQLPRLWKLG